MKRLSLCLNTCRSSTGTSLQAWKAALLKGKSTLRTCSGSGGLKRGVRGGREGR
jgi:hypothetical protein